jgi:acetyl esterase/lipase
METMDIVLPAGEFAATQKPSSMSSMSDGSSDKVLVYLHGGGFVACTSLCLLHSVPIPLARNGYV